MPSTTSTPCWQRTRICPRRRPWPLPPPGVGRRGRAIRRRAIRHLEKGRIVIFGAGTSNPYFSTDTAATLRALEIHADIIAKATRVDGVYDKDPLKFDGAIRYSEITYLEVLSKALGVMDATSIAMCRDNKLPIIVFNLNTTGNIMRMAMGEAIGTLIH